MGPPATPPRRSERGASLLLAMLVLMVLIVVVFQVRFTSSVEADQARSIVISTRYRMLAQAAVQQAQASLLMDVEPAEDEGGQEGGFDANAADEQSQEAADLFAGGSSEGAEEGSEEDTGPSVDEVTSMTDSLLDEWNDPLALAPPMGGDLDVYVEVEDEDGKLNLLGLWTEDELARMEHREAVRRLLDLAFEGTTLDLSYPESAALLDKLDDWVRGSRGTDQPVPKPRLKPANASEAPPPEEEGDEEAAPEEEAAEPVPPAFPPDERNYPMSLGELLIVQGADFQFRGLRPEHLSGFVENDVFYPGLERLLTLTSHLELKPDEKKGDAYADSPFGSTFGVPDSAVAEADAPITTAQPTGNGMVNINTAPLAVLRALAGDDVPITFLERLVEYRKKINEYRANPLSSSSLLGGAGTDTFGKTEEEEDITRYVFQATDEIFPKIEEEYFLSGSMNEQLKDAFTARFGVESHVFTIKVIIERPGEEKSLHPRRCYRTTIWRMETNKQPYCVTLVPFEEYHDPRRLKDLEVDLDALGTGRDQLIDQLEFGVH